MSFDDGYEEKKESDGLSRQYLMQGSCPGCGATITFETDSLALIMLQCGGCGKGVAHHDGRIFLTRIEFLENLVHKHGSKICGEVQTCDLSSRYSKGSIVDPEKVRHAIVDDVIEDANKTIERLFAL